MTRLVATAALVHLMAAAGCSARAADPRDAATDPVADGAPPSEYPDVVATYGAINTVAGLGTIRAKGENGWEPAYEGGPALEAELSRPHIALASEAGDIYIADKDAHAVRVIRGGIISTVAGTGVDGDDGDAPGPGRERALSAPNGLWLGGDGTVYILDLGNDKVRRLDASGELTTMFVIGGAGVGRGLWVADDESRALVAAGNAIKEWTSAGGVRVFASGFVSLGNIAVDSDGSVLAADRGSHRVFRIDADGSKTIIAGNGSTTGGKSGDRATDVGLDEVRGVWPHPAGGALLATHRGGQIWYLDRAGRAHLFVDGDSENSHAGDGEHFQSPGKKISEPRAVTMAPDGRILITESDYGYIRVIELAD